MKELADYYRAADVLVQGSLEEGLGFSPLEALACEVPVVASAVGGLAAHLDPVATLTPRARRRGDGIGHPAGGVESWRGARAGAPRREYVARYWNRARAFAELRQVLAEAGGHAPVPVAAGGARMTGCPAAWRSSRTCARSSGTAWTSCPSCCCAGLRHPALRAVDVTRALSAPGPPCHSSTMGA
jgi:hypothetical protein